MVSVRKRKMNRSSVRKATRRVKDKHRKINVRGNPIIAANWDYDATLAQNYKRLGLAVKLETPAGGVEKDFTKDDDKEEEEEEEEEEEDKDDDEEEGEKPQAAESSNSKGDIDASEIPHGEARIIKDGAGKIIKVIHGTKRVDIESDSEDEYAPVKPKTKVVEELEAYANRELITTERYQSTREQDWLKELYEKYGDDYEAMKWDKKLNINQNSAGDLKKKFKKWKKTNKIT
ncbi:Nop16 protein [Saccharomycopsis crataegensis]|uniref:Nucleolar protein 16 n=1 Tax=Saccharomycopsis crataegensis TaxID=43959 RepID=A0AAV5QRV0_9ASCO|nr:Nop16 protein [Saccharomycopsis crataegensis]